MKKIIVGQGSCGIAAGAGKVYNAIEAKKSDSFSLGITGCIGMCYLEPVVDIYEDDVLIARLTKVTENDAEKIVAAVVDGLRDIDAAVAAAALAVDPAGGLVVAPVGVASLGEDLGGGGDDL